MVHEQGRTAGAAIALFCCVALAGCGRTPLSDAQLVEVVDGDTVRLQVDGSVESVRLVGVNAPERGECMSADATAFVESALDGARITLEADVSDRDQYGRLLRYVYADDALVNEALVAAGLAVAHRYEPDTRLAEALEAAQHRAQAAGRGMWASTACGPGTAAQVEIVEVVWDAPGDDGANPNGEWVELRNAAATSLDLSGWQVKDTSASHRYTFPDGFGLAASATVRLHTGCGRDTADALYWCVQGSAVWNNDGDTAFLLDPRGNIVDAWAY